MASKTIQHADGSATIIYDTFSPFGAPGGTPSRPEPTPAELEAKARANRMLARELATTLNTPADRLDEWGKYGLPQSTGRSLPKLPWGNGEPVWSRREITTWLDDLRAMVARLRPR